MITQNEIDRFDRCIQSALLTEHERHGVGTLGERALHVILKNFFAPDKATHEIKLEGFVADAFDGEGVTEIQTRGLRRMERKLVELTKKYHVNVVFPIASEKYISWISPANGEISERRRSPKRGKPWDFLYELYGLRPVLPMKNLTFTLVFMKIDEFRLLDGYSRDKKRGSNRYERIPTALSDIITLDAPSDYKILIPEELGERFTAKEFQKAAKMTQKTASRAIKTLVTLGVIAHTGNMGRAYLYERT